MSETDIQRRIQMEASRLGARLFRNNILAAWPGEATRLQDGSVLIRHPRRVECGIPGPGGSDLFGWITRPDGVAQVVACEIKTPTGRVSQLQQNWLDCVANAGGIAGVCRSPDDLRRLLGK